MIKKVLKENYKKDKVVLFCRNKKNLKIIEEWATSNKLSFLSVEFPEILKGKESCNFLIGFSDKNDNLVINDFSDLGSSFENITNTIKYLVKKIKIDSIYSFKHELLIDFTNDIELFFEVLNIINLTEKDIFSYRSTTGIAEAKSKGKKVGRPKSETPLPHPLDKHKNKIKKYLKNGYSIQKLAKLYNVTYRQMSYYILSRKLK